MDYYKREELTKIVLRSCKLLDCPIDQEGAKELAGRARGTPRIANNLIHFTRDYAEERADGKITRAIACNALDLLAIDSHGLDEMDKRTSKLWPKIIRVDRLTWYDCSWCWRRGAYLEEARAFLIRRLPPNGPRSSSYLQRLKYLVSDGQSSLSDQMELM